MSLAPLIDSLRALGSGAVFGGSRIVQGADGAGRCLSMAHGKVDSGAEVASNVRSALWRQTLLMSCVLAGCLGLITLLVVF